MKIIIVVLFSLVAVETQSFPYISFMGETLSNHSYVQFSQQENNTLQCHTGLDTCCNREGGSGHGGWYFPNGSRLNEMEHHGSVYETRLPQRVDLHYTQGSPVDISGIYTCSIETEAVHNTTYQDTVYVGVYFSGGEEMICA